MKKVIYLLSIATIICTLDCTSSKLSNSNPKIDSPSPSNTNATALQSPQPYESESADLLIIKNYAESYEPNSQDKHDPPFLPEKESQALERLANHKSKEHEKYILLIFLRLYRSHLVNFYQSHELVGKDFLTKEFFRIVSADQIVHPDQYKNTDFTTTDIAHEVVINNINKYNYPLFEKEMKKIKRAEDKINSIYKK